MCSISDLRPLSVVYVRIGLPFVAFVFQPMGELNPCSTHSLLPYIAKFNSRMIHTNALLLHVNFLQKAGVGSQPKSASGSSALWWLLLLVRHRRRNINISTLMLKSIRWNALNSQPPNVKITSLELLVLLHMDLTSGRKMNQRHIFKTVIDRPQVLPHQTRKPIETCVCAIEWNYPTLQLFSNPREGQQNFVLSFHWKCAKCVKKTAFGNRCEDRRLRQSAFSGSPQTPNMLLHI